MANEIKLQMMTAEELRKHIHECEIMLQEKENKEFLGMVGNLASLAHELSTKYPHTMLRVSVYCEGCEDDIDVDIDIDHLTFEDNYIKY